MRFWLAGPTSPRDILNLAMRPFWHQSEKIYDTDAHALSCSIHTGIVHAAMLPHPFTRIDKEPFISYCARRSCVYKLSGCVFV